MTPNDMQTVLRQLNTLVEGWAVTDDIPPIERDLVLDKLRAIYDALRVPEAAAPVVGGSPVSINLDEVLSVGEPEFSSEANAPEETVQTPVAEPEAVRTQSDSAPAGAEEPRSDAVSSEAPVQYAEPADSEVAEPQSESVPPVEKPQPAAPTLFGADESGELLRHRQKQRVLMSLYDMSEPVPQPAEAPAPQPALQPEPVSESQPVSKREPISGDDDEMMIEEIELSDEGEGTEYGTRAAESRKAESGASDPDYREKRETVLGEVVNPHVQTLADSLMATQRPGFGVTQSEPVTDLSRAIGINDRFLMIRDLFGGDAAAYDRTIEVLNGFEDFDDCMIYLAENYAWNPNSDGAKFLMELIQRKLS